MVKTGRLNHLFENWQKKYSFNVFMKDGIVCEDRYERVMFILKDVNNAKPDECNDMREYVQTSLDGGKTWFNVARWTSALLDGKSYADLVNSIKETYKNNTHEFQHEQLRRVAIVNLKKEAGGSTVNDNVINECASRQKEELLDEIAICDPEIIVVCGLGIFSGVKNVLGKVMPIAKDRPNFEMVKDWEISTVSLAGKNCTIVQFRHPSTGCSAEKSYNDMLKIREFIK